jgi:hypothetical protein
MKPPITISKVLQDRYTLINSETATELTMERIILSCSDYIDHMQVKIKEACEDGKNRIDLEYQISSKDTAVTIYNALYIMHKLGYCLYPALDYFISYTEPNFFRSETFTAQATISW